MKIGFSKCTAVERWLWFCMLFVFLTAFILQWALPPHLQLHCPFHTFTGLPCPSCGASRAVARLLEGNVMAAASMQPLIFFLLLLFLPFSLYALPALLFNWPLPKLKTHSKNEWRTWIGVSAFLILINWAYLITQHR